MGNFNITPHTGRYWILKLDEYLKIQEKHDVSSVSLLQYALPAIQYRSCRGNKLFRSAPSSMLMHLLLLHQRQHGYRGGKKDQVRSLCSTWLAFAHRVREQWFWAWTSEVRKYFRNATTNAALFSEPRSQTTTWNQRLRSAHTQFEEDPFISYHKMLQQLQTRSEAHVTLISLHVCSMFVMSSTKWDFCSMSSPRLLDFLKSFTFSYHFNIAKNSLFHCIHTPIKLCGNTKHQAKAITSCLVNIYIWEEKKEEEKRVLWGRLIQILNSGYITSDFWI